MILHSSIIPSLPLLKGHKREICKIITWREITFGISHVFRIAAYSVNQVAKIQSHVSHLNNNPPEAVASTPKQDEGKVNLNTSLKFLS